MPTKKESTEIEVVGNGEVSAIDPDILREMEAASLAAKKEIDLQEDVRLPALQLVQATTNVGDIDATPGQLIDTLTSQAYKDVDVVPVAMFKTRAFFGGGSIGDPPTCTSPNAVDGYGNPGDTLTNRGPKGGGSCKSCPEGNWRTGGKCQQRYNYLVMVLGDATNPEDYANELPRGLMMHGTSAKTASKLNTLLLSGKFPWSNVVKLSSTQEKNDRGNYRVWSVGKTRGATNEEMLVAFQLSKQIAASRNVSIDGEESTQPATATASSGDGGDDLPF